MSAMEIRMTFAYVFATWQMQLTNVLRVWIRN